MAFTFEADWNAKGNHAPVPTITTAQEVEDTVVKVCSGKTSTEAPIQALLGLIATRSSLCIVQKGLHQDELFGTLGGEQHVRIRAQIGPGNSVTFHIYLSLISAVMGRGKKATKTTISALSSISYYLGGKRKSTTY